MKSAFYSIIISFIFLYNGLEAQTNTDYFGTGQSVGVTVSSSSNQADSDASNSLSGTELLTDYVGASRFLAQATMGANEADIQNVLNIGIDAWLDEQITMPIASSYNQKYREIYDEVISRIGAVYGAANTDSTRRNDYLSFAYYQKTFTEQDVLRQKIAFALSQIFVVSMNSGINKRGFGFSSYYDVLYTNAFGNFRDILYDVSLHPMMGIYLSHFKNQKGDPVEGTLPDENYAREIMQLFTIGLFELNNDGTLKLDINGNPIQTYSIEDVQELAKVFTGFSGGDWDLVLKPENTGTPLTFSKAINHYDLTVPMFMHEDRHETSAKTLPDGTIIPANQTGLQDVNMVIDWLFNHPNVGPFIGKRLIQQLVKSNPTPEYVNRVASAFNNDGSGVRGNMEAVVRAILTDPEARDCAFISDPKAGKLLQPMERVINLFKALDISTPSGKFWFKDYAAAGFVDELEQAFLFAPSVFNFFSPFYAESEFVAPNNMVSPEFQILHSTSGIHYINVIEDAIKVRPFKNKTGVDETNASLEFNEIDYPTLDFSTEENILTTLGINALIDHLDLYLCRGQLQASVKAHIIDNYNQNINNGTNLDNLEIVEDVLYYIMMSPSYVILK